MNTPKARKEVASLNWIFCKPENKSEFKSALKLLEKSLDQDSYHCRYHTLLLQRASDWEKLDFDKQLLLQGTDIPRNYSIQSYSVCFVSAFSSSLLSTYTCT